MNDLLTHNRRHKEIRVFWETSRGNTISVSIHDAIIWCMMDGIVDIAQYGQNLVSIMISEKLITNVELIGNTLYIKVKA